MVLGGCYLPGSVGCSAVSPCSGTALGGGRSEQLRVRLLLNLRGEMCSCLAGAGLA